MLFGLFGDYNYRFLGFRGLIYDFWIVWRSILNLKYFGDWSVIFKARRPKCNFTSWSDFGGLLYLIIWEWVLGVVWASKLHMHLHVFWCSHSTVPSFLIWALLLVIITATCSCQHDLPPASGVWPSAWTSRWVEWHL